MNDNQKIAVAISIPAALLATLATCVTINVDTPKSDGGSTPVVDSGTVVIGEGEGEGGGEVAVGEGEGEGEGEKVADAGTVKPPAVDAGTTPVVVDAGTAAASPPGINWGNVRGINHTFWWGWGGLGKATIDAVADSGANTIRMVFGPDMGDDTPVEQKVVIDHALSRNLLPIVSEMGATCKTDAASLDAVMTRWLDPTRAEYFKQYGKRVIVNIANEWGGFDGGAWSTVYSAAIKSLRAAGYTSTIVVDAGGACGQNPRTVRDFGQVVVDADPLHDVVFSVHLYAYHRTSGATDIGRWNDSGSQSPWLTSAELAAIKNKGLRVIVGEVGWQGSPQVGYDTKKMLISLQEISVGWIAWSVNQNSDAELDLTLFSRPPNVSLSRDNLSPGGLLFIEDSDVGLRKNARSLSDTGR